MMYRKTLRLLLLLTAGLAATLSACGGGSGSDSGADNEGGDQRDNSVAGAVYLYCFLSARQTSHITNRRQDDAGVCPFCAGIP